MKPILNVLIVSSLSLVAFAVSSQAFASCVSENQDNASSDPLITINDMSVDLMNYSANLQLIARERFYHFNAPEAEQAEFRDEVADIIIDQRLLAKEALRLGLKANKGFLKETRETIEQRFQDEPRFNENKDLILAYYLCQAERESLISELHQISDNDVSATDDEVLQYYLANPEKFTTPAQNRASVIILGVDPSMPSSAWQDAKTLADSIKFQLDEGADFSALAEEYSTDFSASRGGDLGFVHQGTLGSDVENVLADLNVGEHSEPIRLLDGWSILKLSDRREAKLNTLEKVYSRAKALLIRDKQEQAWANLKQQLRNSSAIDIDRETLQVFTISN